jgi:hypothetical protein
MGMSSDPSLDRIRWALAGQVAEWFLGSNGGQFITIASVCQIDGKLI